MREKIPLSALAFGSSHALVAEGFKEPSAMGLCRRRRLDQARLDGDRGDALGQEAQQVRLVFHRIYQPSPDQPLDFEGTIERTILDLRKRFLLRKALFDPWQMQATAQRLTRFGVKVEEFPQSPANLTTASQNLYELIQGQGLVVYPDADLRLAISRAVAIETPHGWRIGKDKQTHKIDIVIALAMAAHAAVQGQNEYTYDLWSGCVDWDDADEPINLPLGYTRETYEAEMARRARIYANWGKTT